VTKRPERRLPKHSIVLAGHATSISLEAEFWQALQDIAQRDAVAVAALVATIDRERLKTTTNPPSLASAVRVYILKRIQQNR
jgi:predicted DNA-binding ribbon-helix-helix protein